MLGQILTQITQIDKQTNPLITRLKLQNEALHSQLRQIQQELSHLHINQVLQYIDQHNTSFKNHTKLDKIELAIQAVKQFHQLYKKLQSQSKRFDYLEQQMSKILELVSHYDLFGTLQLRYQPSSEVNLHYLKELNEILVQQILEYQNASNINKFQTENEEVCQEYSNVIEFHIKLKDLVTSIYQDLIKSNYEFKDSSLLVKIQHFQSLWTQSNYYSQQFLKDLKKILEKFISYNINDRQYTLTHYNVEKRQEQLQIKKVGEIIFDSNQIPLHYNALISNFQVFQTYFSTLTELVPYQKQNLIVSLKKSLLNNIKSYIQYLLPYLNMDYRRNILSYLSINGQQSDNIYQLLVSLRMCGKDADLLVKTIKRIALKALQNKECLTIIIKFIELAKQNKKNYQMNFFICNQLVEQLEQSQVTVQIAQAIKKILLIREQMRMKIHSSQ